MRPGEPKDLSFALVQILEGVKRDRLTWVPTGRLTSSVLVIPTSSIIRALHLVRAPKAEPLDKYSQPGNWERDDWQVNDLVDQDGDIFFRLRSVLSNKAEEAFFESELPAILERLQAEADAQKNADNEMDAEGAENNGLEGNEEDDEEEEEDEEELEVLFEHSNDGLFDSEDEAAEEPGAGGSDDDYELP